MFLYNFVIITNNKTMKQSNTKWLFRIPLIILAVVILYFGMAILVAYITDYKPQLSEKLPIIAQGSEKNISESEHEFSILSWNIGYCGLGEEQDFFYDGGKMVNPSSELYQKYLNGIFNILKKLDYLDFIMLQEVDIESKRTLRTNQVDAIAEGLSKMSHVTALNYDVKYVPIPVLSPMGRVKAGMVTLSRYLPFAADRVGFDANFNWWKRIFMLDRCIIVTRHKLASGKELVMINVHNSAFDDENVIKPIELNTIKTLMMKEYQRGNFVIAGGDWNQNPPKFDPKSIDKSWNPTTIKPLISETLFPSDWKWVFSNTLPSNRFNDKPYKKGENKTTIIDFFLVSPNVTVNSIETINLDFKLSDHQPILMTFDIAPDTTAVMEKE